MGLGAELLADSVCDTLLEETRYERLCTLADKNLWVTKDGRICPIEAMETGHLQNILKYIRKDSAMFNLYFSKITNELNGRNGLC